MTDTQTPHLFWAINEENGKLSPEIIDTFIFLNQRGYTRRKIGDEIELYRQRGHLVEQVFANDQVSEVIDFLQREFNNKHPDYDEATKLIIDYPKKGPISYEYSPKQILERFAKYGWGKIFNEKNFNHLPELKANIKRHTRDKAYFYFKNGYVEVSGQNSQFHPYSSMGVQCIFKEHLINRDIQLLDVNSPATQEFCKGGYNFFDFLHRLAGVPMQDPETTATPEQREKFAYLLRLIGFLLHDYREEGLTDFCVILCDDNVGGSGKGLIVQACRQMTKVTELDAKKEEKFDPDDMTERTRIKVYNDIQPSFPFSFIYNEITDQAVIRPMWKSPRYVAYGDAWKDLITSNHIVRGNSGADLRRQRVFSVNPFFNKDYTPIQHYGQSFFSNKWTDNDWNYFYNVMFECVKFWLASDYKLDFFDEAYAQLKMEEEFPTELREYVEIIMAEVKTNGTSTYKTSDLYYRFKENEKYRLSPFVRKLNSKFFSIKFREYLDEQKVKYLRNHNRTEITIWL